MKHLVRKILLSTALCGCSVMSVGQMAFMSGLPAATETKWQSADQTKIKTWKDAVRSNAHTITSIKPEENDPYFDLAFLKPILADKRIVSLGEASHGASEYNSIKVRLIKYLHEELGYNVIAFESNLEDTTAAYAQIHNTTSQELMENSIYGVWHVEENLPLFEYIIEQSKTDHPLILTGFDSQGTTEYFIDFAEKWFSEVDRSKGKAFAATEHWYLELSMMDDFKQFNIQKEKIKQKYVIFQKFVEDHKEDLSEAYKEQTELVPMMSRVLQNRIDTLDNLLPHMVKLMAGVNVEKEIKQMSYERDRVMASNAAWLADTAYPDEKMILWGHNYHIRKSNSTMITEHNGFDYYNDPYPTMGEMLPFSLKKDGYAIGLYAYEGSSNKNNGEAEKITPHESDSVENILSDGLGPVRFINMKDVELSPSTEWMYTPRIAKGWGVLDEKMIPRDQYDGILLIHKIQPSKAVQ